ncbi:MAG: hypothetical protein RJA98_3728 [Pseudomonadota bacterium]
MKAVMASQAAVPPGAPAASAALAARGLDARAQRRRWLGLALCAATVPAVIWGWRGLVDVLLPWQSLWLSVWGPGLSLQSLQLQSHGADQSIAASFLVHSVPLASGGVVNFPHAATLTASISAAKALLPALGLMWLLVLWPVADAREFRVRGVLGVAAAAALLALDVPVVLLGLAWGTVAQEIPGLARSLTQGLGHFLDGGGRLALAAAAGFAIVAFSRWLADGWSEPQ